MTTSVLLVLLVVSVLALIVLLLLLRWQGTDADYYAVLAIAAAYNVAIDDEKARGELPDGAARRELALAYYERIPKHKRKFSQTEFALAVEVIFGVVDGVAMKIMERREAVAKGRGA